MGLILEIYEEVLSLLVSFIRSFRPSIRKFHYRGFRIDGPARSWPRRHGKSTSSWPSKNGFGHNSAGLSPILMSVCMVKDTIINKIFRAPGPHRADF